MENGLETRSHDLTKIYNLASLHLGQGYCILIKVSNIENSDYAIIGVENCQDKEPEDDCILQQVFEMWDGGQSLFSLLSLLATLPESYGITLAIHAYED